MAQIAGRRMRAEIDGDFVVFLIGVRFNRRRQLVRSFLDAGGQMYDLNALRGLSYL